MVAWSDGHRTNVIPSEWRKVDDYGRTLFNYYDNLREGDELYLQCTIIRETCQCHEYEADREWERGHHIRALHEMLYAATMVLPDESMGYEFEDMQWFDPHEVFYWHPNIREFLRLMRRCEDYCRREPRLWLLLEGERTYRNYKRYLCALGHWVRE